MFKPYEGNEKYIFVSYNHDDSEKVYDIITEFHHRGYRIWHDKGIPLGDSFLEHLAMREKECSVVFSFLSPAYFESQYCMQELKFAVTNGKPIIPIMLEEFELPTSGDFMMGVINRIYLSWFDSIEEFADQLAEAGAKYLDPCKAKPDGTPPVQPTPPVSPPRPRQTTKPGGDPKNKTWIIAAAVVVVLGILAAVLLPKLLKQEEKPEAASGQITETAAEKASSAPDATSAPEAAAAPEATAAEATSAPETAETPETTEALKETEAPLPAVQPEELAASGQKALRYLSDRIGNGCPLSVYGQKGVNEPDNVYDNALAALALLSDQIKHSNHSDADLRKVLDSLTERVKDESVFAPEIGTGSLGAAALALMKFDQMKPATSYAVAAQKILDRVLKTRENTTGGFNRSTESADRSTEDNLWLYAAFSMLANGTGNSVYEKAAESARGYVLSMLTEDGSFFAAGDGKNGLLSVRTQALAALVLQDSTGIDAVRALCRNGGFPADNQSAENISTEDTALMALAFRSFHMEEESSRALGAIYRCQWENGGVPESDNEQLNDRTSATAWYAMAAEGYNLFQTKE